MPRKASRRIASAHHSTWRDQTKSPPLGLRVPRTAFPVQSVAVLAAPATSDATVIHLAKGYEAPLSLVPEHEPYATQALDEGEPARGHELGVLAQHVGQAIVGNSAAEVVDVVDAVVLS